MSVSGDALFLGGPPERIEKLIGLLRANEPSVGYRIFFFILIGWVPLLDLALVQSALGQQGVVSFANDFAVHARMLIAVPLLVLAEVVCAPRLSMIAGKMLESGVIRDDDYERYTRIRLTTVLLRDAPLVEAVVIALAYFLVFATVLGLPLVGRPAWMTSDTEPLLHTSLAGWWHLLVSAPLLMVLVLSWLWRVFLWAFFLGRVGRLDLRINAAHPDGAGGLGFVGYSVQAFWVVASAFGVIAAGSVGNQIIHHNAPLASAYYVMAALGALSLLIFCGPLAALSAKMIGTWRHATLAYGALARDVGERFEAKWLGAEIGTDALDAPDFSATTDLYSISANVYRMRFFPIAWPSIVLLELATLAPFLPVALATMPLDEILKKIAGFLM